MKEPGEKPTRSWRIPNDLALGVTCLALALSFAVLVLPRGVRPDTTLPLPSTGEASIGEEAFVKAGAPRRRLSFRVRAVGEDLRAFGSARARGLSGSAELTALRQSVRRALRDKLQEELALLLDLQTALFLQAASDWEKAGKVGSELAELGGAFATVAKNSGWLKPTGELVASLSERRALFQIRWLTLTDLAKTAVFAPRLEQWRVYYRFLLRHPEGGEAGPGKLLSYVGALSRLDPSYPADFALGVLNYHSGSTAQAASSFRHHLETHPRGRWNLRAEMALASVLTDAPPELR